MSKAAHKRNAFHYSCWGAKPVRAASNELEKDKFGFTLVGSDGEQHSSPKGYYAAEVTIPTCVPDGDYVMGWVWYGGTGGSIEGNDPQEPVPWGYFGDYWSCSFVRIEGGAALASSCDPVFVNDMGQFSEEGCMSANDEPGICASEPCKVDGTYQKPKSFKNGNRPEPLTPENFGGVIDKSFDSGETLPTPLVSDSSESVPPAPADITPSPVSADEMTVTPSMIITPTAIADTTDSYPEYSSEPEFEGVTIAPSMTPEEPIQQDASKEFVEESGEVLLERSGDEQDRSNSFDFSWYNHLRENMRENLRSQRY
ncbi:hypothetical protein FGB62_125g09 [Gracilaria domingensis]|nr:hypothetical protein FGB62_125g09 [Gracilaria domingensis]